MEGKRKKGQGMRSNNTCVGYRCALSGHSLANKHQCIYITSEEPATSGVDSMEESSDECNSDVSVSDTDSVYVPTPERPVAIKVSRTDLPNGSLLWKFLS